MSAESRRAAHPSIDLVAVDPRGRRESSAVNTKGETATITVDFPDGARIVIHDMEFERLDTVIAFPPEVSGGTLVAFVGPPTHHFVIVGEAKAIGDEGYCYTFQTGEYARDHDHSECCTDLRCVHPTCCGYRGRPVAGEGK